jgi:hypothetical protein
MGEARQRHLQAVANTHPPQERPRVLRRVQGNDAVTHEELGVALQSAFVQYHTTFHPPFLERWRRRVRRALAWLGKPFRKASPQPAAESL